MMLSNGRLKAILILFAGMSFVALGVYQAVVPDAWASGGEWVTNAEGVTEFIINGEATPKQEIEQLKAENESLKKQIASLLKVVMEQLHIISQLAGLGESDFVRSLP
jgi:hypothetical protein